MRTCPPPFFFLILEERGGGFQLYYCLDIHNNIEDCDFVIFEKCKTQAQPKERETFWQHEKD